MAEKFLTSVPGYKTDLEEVASPNQFDETAQVPMYLEPTEEEVQDATTVPPEESHYCLEGYARVMQEIRVHVKV